MTNKALLLIAPLTVCLTWLAIISAGTHLRLIEFMADDNDFLFILGCFIVSFALYFYLLLLATPLLYIFGIPFSGKLIVNVMKTVMLILLLLSIFPGSGRGFLSLNTRDFVFLPSAFAHMVLMEYDIIRDEAIPDPRPTEKLISALKSRNAEVRRNSVKALGDRGDPSAVNPLIVLLKNDEDWYVMNFAADALGRINDPRAIRPLVEYWKNGGKAGGYSYQENAENALLNIDNPLAAKEFLTVLEDKDAVRLHAIAVKVLGRIGDRCAVKPLIDVMTEKGIELEVVKALGKIGDPSAAMPVISVLTKNKSDSTDTDDELRIAAIETLGKIRNPVAVEPLIVLLKSPEARVHICAIKALGKIGDDRATRAIVPLLKSENISIQETAARSLAHTKKYQAVQPLIDLLAKSRCESVRSGVTWSLGTIKDPRVVSPLINILENDPSDDIKEIAAYSLGKTGNSQATDPLVAALKNGKESIRLAAACSLGDIQDVRAIEPLVMSQNDSSKMVTWQASLSLDNFHDPKASAAVENFLSHYNIRKVAKNYGRIIRKGDDNKLFALIFALKRHGTELMANDFVTSEHWLLKEEGEAWLHNHGLQPKRSSRPDAPRWGV